MSSLAAPVELLACVNCLCLHRQFEQQAAATPHAVAVEFAGQSLSYRDLNRKADRVAQRLRGLGVGPDVRVGLWLEPSLELLVGMLGILKAGGAYLPIDRGCPAERAGFILSDAQAVALVADAGLAARLGRSALPVIVLDSSDLPEIAVQAAFENAATPGPDHLAYVIYTSGTTGRPKGTMITHRNVVRLFTSTAPWFDFDETDVWTLFHSAAFDFSVWEIWGAWFYGGRLVVVPPLVSRSPKAFYELLVDQKVTVLSQTPSAFVQLIAAEDKSGPTSSLALRYVIFGGEALEMQTLRPWFDRHGDERPQLVNMYGITETTVHVTYRPLSRTDLDSGSVIGEPIPDLEIHLLDERRQPVPAGTAGEIYVGGPGLARGYLNCPDLTAERFVRHPFHPDPSARLYRSGDRARYRADSGLEYLGRIDHQVKIRGHRVELGEIENVLAGHPFIQQAVVLATRDVSGSNTLTAYLAAPQIPPHTSMRDLSQLLRLKLPDYMVPARFVALPEFPLTVNGKVDRQALAESPGRDLQMGSAYVAARNELEQRLVELWQTVLQREPIGVLDNFFDLGGHSLLAARLTAEIEKQWGNRLPISALFQTPTIAALACMLGQKDWTPRWTSLVPLQPQGTRRPLFCIHGRTGEVYGFLDLANALGPDRPVYGLQAVGLDGRQPRHKTVEEMAAHYVREMRSLQPEGPYLLTGHSLGGWIAYGVAEELHRQGQAVSVLALLDTGPNAHLPFLPRIEVRTLFMVQLTVFHLRHARVHLKRFFGRDRRQSLGKTAVRLIRSFFNFNPSHGFIPPSPGADAARLSAQAHPFDYFHAVVSRYRPHKYPGTLTLCTVRTTRRHRFSFWKHLSRNKLNAVQLPGNHDNLIEKENAVASAVIFKRVFHQAETSCSASSSDPA